MMAQISLSAIPEGSEYVEGLESYKDCKKILNGESGRILSACIGMSRASGFADDELSKEGVDIPETWIDMILGLASEEGGNAKRIKGDKNNFVGCARGEAGAARGQALSCPSSNLELINIDRKEVESYDLEKAMKMTGIGKEIMDQFDLNPSNVKKYMRYLLGREGRSNFFITNPNRSSQKFKMKSSVTAFLDQTFSVTNLRKEWNSRTK
jgi:hypothetical protein